MRAARRENRGRQTDTGADVRFVRLRGRLDVLDQQLFPRELIDLGLTIERQRVRRGPSRRASTR